MAVLGAIAYDPGTAVSKDCASLLAMTAIDTTNLRITFNAPANGSVLVRLKGQVHGATTFPRILLGVLDGATRMGRMSPTGHVIGLFATNIAAQECVFVITGLTPSQSYTWDAAYGVDIVVASTGLKYGGPDNTTGDDAFGAFLFEVWEAHNLLAGKLHDPLAANTKSFASLLAMTALDTTNLRLTFAAPASGQVLWRIKTQQHGSTTVGQPLLGILDGSTVKARSAPVSAWQGTSVGTGCFALEASGIISGLTPTTSYTWDAAYGVETVSAGAALKYGGPNDTTTNNTFGGIAYEIWAA